jgi:CyaY protein
MSRSLDDATFRRLSDEALTALARWLADFDPDELDFAEADGVVTLEFADGARFVVNRQAGSRQLWYAAGARAWHYDWDGKRWLDDRDGHELSSNVQRTVTEKLGRSVPGPGPLHAR